jgi:hypothetical protein
MATAPKQIPLRPPKGPNLLIAPVDYTQLYQNQLNNALRLYFNQLDSFTQAITIPPSGATADRPIEKLQVGQYYFDTTVGLPIYWDGTNWIDAAGNVV